MEKTAGVCTDGLTIDGPTRRDPAQVCGRLAGQHIYVETGRSGTPTTFTFDTSNDDSRWRIKVTYYECSNLRRSPEGCLQYFTGVSGEFQSFSFNDGDTSILLNTDYVICFRRERGFCQIDYSVQPNDGMEFVLGAAGTQNGGAVADQNKAVYLEISGSSSELYSGQTFADVVPTTSTSSQTTNGVVRGIKVEIEDLYFTLILDFHMPLTMKNVQTRKHLYTCFLQLMDRLLELAFFPPKVR